MASIKHSLSGFSRCTKKWPRGYLSAGTRVDQVVQIRRAGSMACKAHPEVAFYFPTNPTTDLIEAGGSPVPIPVTPVVAADVDGLLSQSPGLKSWASISKFKAKSGEILLMPKDDGTVSRVYVGVDSLSDMWGYAALPMKLPAGSYQLEVPLSPQEADAAALGIMLAGYSFKRYKSEKKDEPKPEKPKIVWPAGANRTTTTAIASAYYWARDLITTPAEDMGPGHLAAEAAAMAAAHGASFNVIVGEDLLTQGYPAVHTVGRACSRPPRLIDIRWQPQGVSDPDSLPRLALVGKGVCFDSGGLDIKPAAGMLTMKTDMGGAALMLALAHIIMSHNLPVRLRLMVPAVENSISGNSYRPLDVLQTRAGITVENMNTDAEGRLILSDAMYEAATEKPDLLIDAATLTGAARIALGYELPAMYTNSDDVWHAVEKAGHAEGDQFWRLPLHAAYRKLLDSKVADIASTGPPGGYGGSITAALFLQEFVKDLPRWIHIDTFAYTDGKMAGPGRPEGGEAQGLRALWRFLQDRYGAKPTN